MRIRPTWDQTFMRIAIEVAKRSACVYYQVGAVFARENQFLQMGFNGPTKGKKNHCNEIGCAKEVNGVMLPPGSKKCRGAHAETNAIANAAKMGVSLEGATVYCTWSPCYDCAKTLTNLGIVKFVYITEYETEFTQVNELFKENGIELIKFIEEV